MQKGPSPTPQPPKIFTPTPIKLLLHFGRVPKHCNLKMLRRLRADARRAGVNPDCLRSQRRDGYAVNIAKAHACRHSALWVF